MTRFYSDHNFKEELVEDMPSTSYGFAKGLSEIDLIKSSYKNDSRYTILRPFHLVSKYEKFSNKSHIITDFVYKKYVLSKSVFSINV